MECHLDNATTPGGFILLRSDLAKQQVHGNPLDVAGADTQGAIGYFIQQCSQNELFKSG